ncbi:MAG: class I SAM-dependent methyltransferase [bacterium]|nr:class I SAM-dependent methyltransferase [bacterium]
MKSATKKENWDEFWVMKNKSKFEKSSAKKRMNMILDKYVTSGMTVLDAGSGCGFFSNYLIKKGCKVYSLDYSKDALKLTKRYTENRSEEYISDNLMNSELGKKYKNKFDIIFSDGLFEHFSLQHQKTILRNFREMKKKDGLIITFVPNLFTLWTFIRPFLMPGIKEKPFSGKRLRRLFSEFECVASGGINVFPINISPEFLGKNVGMLRYIIVK